MDYNRNWLIDLSSGKSKLVSLNCSNNLGAIEIKMNGSVLDEKSSFKDAAPTLSLFIVYIANTVSKKLEH